MNADLAEIVEDFKLNIDRISHERLVEVFQMIGEELNRRIPSDTISKTRLNVIIDKIEAETIHSSGEDDMVGAIEGFSRRVREEVQKLDK